MSDTHDSAQVPEQSPLENYRGVVQPFDVYVNTVVVESPLGEPIGPNLSIYAAQLVKRLAEFTSGEFDEQFNRWLMEYLATRRSRPNTGRPRRLNSAQIATEYRFYTEFMGLTRTSALHRIAWLESVDFRTVRAAVGRGLKYPEVASLRWARRSKNP